MNKEEQKRIYDIIQDDDFPEDQLHFCEEFYRVSRNWYISIGFAIVDGKGYKFSYSDDEGIYDDSIEEDNTAFDYIKKSDKK